MVQNHFGEILFTLKYYRNLKNMKFIENLSTKLCENCVTLKKITRQNFVQTNFASTFVTWQNLSHTQKLAQSRGTTSSLREQLQISIDNYSSKSFN